MQEFESEYHNLTEPCVHARVNQGIVYPQNVILCYTMFASACVCFRLLYKTFHIACRHMVQQVFQCANVMLNMYMTSIG